MNDFFAGTLAKLLDKLKMANPLVYSIIVVVLTTFITVVNNGLITLPSFITTTVIPIIVLVLGASGARTTRYLNK